MLQSHIYILHMWWDWFFFSYCVMKLLFSRIDPPVSLSYVSLIADFSRDFVISLFSRLVFLFSLGKIMIFCGWWTLFQFSVSAVLCLICGFFYKQYSSFRYGFPFLRFLWFGVFGSMCSPHVVVGKMFWNINFLLTNNIFLSERAIWRTEESTKLRAGTASKLTSIKVTQYHLKKSEYQN